MAYSAYAVIKLTILDLAPVQPDSWVPCSHKMIAWEKLEDKISSQVIATGMNSQDYSLETNKKKEKEQKKKKKKNHAFFNT